MRLKNEDIKEIARLVDDGYSPGYIANQFNYSTGSMESIVLRYKKHGLNGILHKTNSNKFTIEEKISIINRYYSGESQRSLAVEINVNDCVIYNWILKYEKLGYNGLIDNRGRPGVTKMGRLRKNPKIEQPSSTNEAMAPLTDEERQELNELRKKIFNLDNDPSNIEYIKTLLELRNALIENGERDPALPIGEKVEITTDTIQKIENTANGLQYCVDYAEGDSGIFTAQLQRIMRDNGPIKRGR